MTLIYAVKGKSETRDIIAKDVDGNAIIVGANDLIRASIGRQKQTAVFTVTSGTDTAAGSSFTKGATGTNRLRIVGADLDFQPGIYTMTIDFRDNSDGQEWKIIDRQTFGMEGV